MLIQKNILDPEMRDKELAPFPFYGELLLTGFNERENNHIMRFVEEIWNGKPKVPGFKTFVSFKEGIHLIVNADSEGKLNKILDDVQDIIVREFNKEGFTAQVM